MVPRARLATSQIGIPAPSGGGPITRLLRPENIRGFGATFGLLADSDTGGEFLGMFANTQGRLLSSGRLADVVCPYDF
jgi:hypothetical protein